MITTYQGTMQEQLKNVADDSINLLLTDPPYNISEKGAKPVWIDPITGENKNGIHSQQFSETFDENWDAVTHEQFLDQLDEWSKLWFTKMKKGAAFAIFISDQYISYLWKIMEANGFEPKRIITWKKPAAVPFNRKVNPVSGCEFILWGIKPNGTRTFNSATDWGNLIDRYSMADKVSSIVYRMIKDNIHTDSLDNIFNTAKKEAKKMIDERKVKDGKIQAIIPNTITYSGGLGNRIHPTQKPVELLTYFIELLTNKDDIVLDTFAGSGSTGIACNNCGRNAILIERDEKMYKKMAEQFSTPEYTLLEIK